VIDFGFDKIALIGAVALIVIGPEKLPRVARTSATSSARRSVMWPT
jgi:sec-independent protein translocase protein TatB